MASKSICSRCLRAGVAKTAALPFRSPLIQRASISSSTPLKNQTRKLHQSSQQKSSAAQAQAAPLTPIPEESRVLLKPNNLFHSFTNSPSPAIRARARHIRQNSYCPHPDHQHAGASHNSYECPDCGIPVSCSEEHFVDDYESHLEICDLLREINQDDHDLMSGRFFPEFEYPPAGMDEAQVNLTNWDTLLFSREFNAVNDERSMRQVTRLLTYPITIGSILHELSPYSLKDRLLPEGLRSLSGMLPPHTSPCSTDIILSPPLYSPPASYWRRHRYQGSPSQPSSRPSLHPWSPC